MSRVQPRLRPLALIAEDEPLIMMETADLLGDLGYAVIEAQTAAQALAAFSSHHDIALLVTDVQMPGPMKGFELARTIQAAHPDVRIIVCSGQLRPGPDELPTSVTFLDKPLSAILLSRILQSS